MWSIREELMKRYGMTEAEAEELIKKAKKDLEEYIAVGEMHLVFAKNDSALVQVILAL